MPDHKQHLADLVSALVMNDTATAQTAFQQYMVKKTHELINPAPPSEENQSTEKSK